MLVGDLMQLKPVQARWIFEYPSDEKNKIFSEVYPLWNQFSAVVLEENRRQGHKRQWADTLNRIHYFSFVSYDLVNYKVIQGVN